MKKVLVRCYKGFAEANGKFNIEVVFTLPDMGYYKKLFTCIHCGELFAVDQENPQLAGKPLDEFVSKEVCPKCGSSLTQTLRAYPENFLTDDGKIGHFIPGHIIPPDSESLVMEVWELP